MGKIHGVILLVVGLVVLFCVTVFVLYTTGAMVVWMGRGPLGVSGAVDFSVVTTGYTMGIIFLAWPLTSFWLDTVIRTFGDVESD